MNTNKDYYGQTLPPHETLIVDPDDGVLRKEFHLFKTANVVVGEEDAVVTDTFTLTINSIDERWFRKIKGFAPFKVTQTAADTIVAEWPTAHFDYFFAPRMNKNNEFNKKDIETAFMVSDKAQEQIQYELGRARIVDSKNRNDDWRFRLALKIKGKTLDYQLAEPDAREGEIPFQFLFAPLPSLKWTIATVPDAKNKLRTKEKEETEVSDLFDLFKKKRAALIQEAKAVKDEEEDGKSSY